MAPVPRVLAFLAALVAFVVAPAGAAAGQARVPFDRIPAASQERVRDVVEHAAFRHAVEGLTFRSREPVFLYLLDHPDFGASVARALGLAEYRVDRRSDGTYWLDDARGLTGIFQVVYADAQKRVVHARGVYDSERLPTMHGRVVLILKLEHRQGDDGASRVTNDLAGHLQLDNPILGLLVRLVGPFVRGTVDRKVARTFRVIAEVSERAHDDPGGLLRALRGHPEIERAHLEALAALVSAPAGEPAGKGAW